MICRLKIDCTVKYTLLIAVAIAIGYLQLLPVKIGGIFTVPLISVFFVFFAFFEANFSSVRMGKKIGKYTSKYSIVFLIILGYIFINLIYTVFLYGYDLRDIIISLEPYLFFFIIYPMLYCFHSDCSVSNGIIRSIYKLCVFLLLVKYTCWILYHFNGIVLFERLLFQYKNWIRAGFQRLDTGPFFSCLISYSLFCSYVSKYKILYILQLAIFISFALFVTQSRILIPCILLSLCVELYFLISPRKRIYYLFLISCIVVLFLFSNYLNIFLNMFSVDTLEYTNSNKARYSSLLYFLNMYLSDHPLMGLGMLVSTNFEVSKLLILDGKTVFLDDIGGLGLIVRFGIGGIILYLVTYYIFIITFIKVRNKQYGAFIIGVLVYTMCHGFFLNLYEPQIAIETFAYLALSFFILKHVNNNKDTFNNRSSC